MKNPGTAKFKYADKKAVTSTELLTALKNFDDGSLKEAWYEFIPDRTMYCIEKLFTAYYSFHGEKLEGIIQLFNLFYLREADLDKALKKADIHELANMIDYDITHLQAPVYLGYGNLAWHKDYREKAEKYFNASKQLGMKYLSDNFQQERYIHPLYLMCYGNHTKACVTKRYQFIQNKQQPKIPEEELQHIKARRIKLNNKQIMDNVICQLRKYKYSFSEEKNHRFIFGKKWELTITDMEGGFVGLRYHIPKSEQNKIKNHNYVKCNCYDVEEIKIIRNILDKYLFNTNQNVWLGKKAFTDYSSSEESVVIKAIMQEIVKLEEKLNQI